MANMQGEKKAPKKGDKYRCKQCGMEIQVTADCKGEGKGGPTFQCCGKDLAKV